MATLNHESECQDEIIYVKEIVNITNYKNLLNYFSTEEKQELVWGGKHIEIVIGRSNYVSGEYRFNYYQQQGFQFGELIEIICERYNEMYRQEEAMCGPSRMSSNGRRIPTYGPYGFTHYFPKNLGLKNIYISPLGVVKFDTIVYL